MLDQYESIYFRLSISQRPQLMKNVFIASSWVQFQTLLKCRDIEGSPRYHLENRRLENLLDLAEINSHYSKGQLEANLINWYHFDNGGIENAQTL